MTCYDSSLADGIIIAVILCVFAICALGAYAIYKRHEP